MESIHDWANWDSLSFFVNLTFVESLDIHTPCNSKVDQGDFIAAIRDVANFRPEYTTVDFVTCSDSVMVFQVSHTVEAVVSGRYIP